MTYNLMNQLEYKLQQLKSDYSFLDSQSRLPRLPSEQQALDCITEEITETRIALQTLYSKFIK